MLGKASFTFLYIGVWEKVSERYFCWAQTTSQRKAEQNGPSSPLSQSRCPWEGAASQSSPLPCMLAPLHRMRTGIRQVDLLSRSMAASPLVRISLLSLSFVPFSSLGLGFELLQSYQRSAIAGGNAKQQDTNWKCQNSSKSLFIHNAKVWTQPSLSLIKNVNIKQMKG